MTRLIAIALVAGGTAVLAQEAFQTLPEQYKLQFENQYVRVTRVLYPPHAKLPAHAHTSLAAAYVYLSDSGPVVYRHIGADYGAITRKPTVARSFRLYRGVTESHEVENLSDLPSEFLRVEFKTEPIDPRSLAGRFLPETVTGAVLEKVQFENPQVRITRLYAPKGATLELAGSTHPSLLVALSGANLGAVRWLAKGTTEVLGDTAIPTEAIRFELRTAPLKVGETPKGSPGAAE